MAPGMCFRAAVGFKEWRNNGLQAQGRWDTKMRKLPCGGAARKAGSSRQVSVDEEMEELLGQGSRSALLLWQELCWPTASFHPLSSGEKK